MEIIETINFIDDHNNSQTESKLGEHSIKTI